MGYLRISLLWKPLMSLFACMGFAAMLEVSAQGNQDYWHYHERVGLAEQLIVEGGYAEALAVYDSLGAEYGFIFLRDCKVAAQLAFFLNKQEKGFKWLSKGADAGWSLKGIKKNRLISKMRNSPKWVGFEEEYAGIRERYLSSLNTPLRTQVREMFKADQRKALGALLKIGDRAQERYATAKFGPHSRNQMQQLSEILDGKGYAGERLIGNNYWLSTIISHHNSVTQAYVRQDTLYPKLRPRLLAEVGRGYMSPYEFALVEDWYIAVYHHRKNPGYGYLNLPRKSTLDQTNRLRKQVGLRSVGLRNQLIEVEKRTGINFYLPDWLKGKIPIEGE